MGSISWCWAHPCLTLLDPNGKQFPPTNSSSALNSSSKFAAFREMHFVTYELKLLYILPAKQYEIKAKQCYYYSLEPKILSKSKSLVMGLEHW